MYRLSCAPIHFRLSHPQCKNTHKPFIYLSVYLGLVGKSYLVGSRISIPAGQLSTKNPFQTAPTRSYSASLLLQSPTGCGARAG